MEWSGIFQLIDSKMFIVVAACWVIGYVLKKTPQVPDWSIAYIVTVVSVLLTIWMVDLSPQSVIQGVLAGAFAVYGHQLLKQGKEGAGK
jgi:hypothetical protein